MVCMNKFKYENWMQLHLFQTHVFKATLTHTEQRKSVKKRVICSALPALITVNHFSESFFSWTNLA